MSSPERHGWFDSNGANTQAIMDKEINDAADHGLDFWAFDDFWGCTQFAEDQNCAPFYEAFKEYMASPYKNRLKFALISQGGGMAYGSGSHVTPGFWTNTDRPRMINLFKDPQYLKVDGNRPVLFIMGDISNFLAQWESPNYPGWNTVHQQFNQAAADAGLGPPLLVNVAMDMSAKGANFDSVTSYGGMGVSGGISAVPTIGYVHDPDDPSHQHFPYARQIAQDESNWNAIKQAGLRVIPGLTPVDDPRPLWPFGYYWRVDQPTYSEWEQELKDAVAFERSNPSNVTNPPIALIYAWNEISEGGPGIIPTQQNGTMFLDAIKAVKTGNYPSTYTDVYNGDNLAIKFTAVGSGYWTNYGPIGGNFNNDEEISGVAGDSASLTVDAATGFTITGTKGPNRGKMRVYIDGSDQGTFTLTASQWTVKQTLFQKSALPAGTHTLKIVNASTDPSATQLGIDTISVTKEAK
jgi:hypothetical protein